MKDRARLFILTHFNMALGAEPLAEAYVFRARERLSRVPGFVDLMLWVAYGDSDEAMLIFEFEHEEGVNGGLAALGEGHMALVEQGLTLAPPLNIVFESYVHDGFLLSDSSTKHTLSYTLRGPTSYGAPSLEEDLRMVLANLREMPGYQGSYAGPRVSLEEEWVSIVHWESYEAFERSLPPQSLYLVKAYHRVV